VVWVRTQGQGSRQNSGGKEKAWKGEGAPVEAKKNLKGGTALERERKGTYAVPAKRGTQDTRGDEPPYVQSHASEKKEKTQSQTKKGVISWWLDQEEKKAEKKKNKKKRKLLMSLEKVPQGSTLTVSD